MVRGPVHPLLASVLALAVVLVPVGCGGAGDAGARTGSSVGPASTLPPEMSELVADGPLDLLAWALAGGITDKQAGEVRERAVSSCMSDRGFDYPVVDRVSSAWTTVGDYLSALRTSGFSVAPPDDGLTAENDPLLEVLDGLGPADRRAYMAALSGDDLPEDGPSFLPGSCLAEAHDAVAAAQPDQATKEELERMGAELTRQAEWVRAADEFDRCMEAKGFRDVLSDPRIAEWQRRPPGTEPSADELAMAQSFADCREPQMLVERRLIFGLLDDFTEQHPELADVVRSTAAWR